MWNHLPSGYLLDKIIYDEQPNEQNKGPHPEKERIYLQVFNIFES